MRDVGFGLEQMEEAAARIATLDSAPTTRSSQSTSCGPYRHICRERTPASPLCRNQVTACTWLLGRELPSGVCQERSNFQARSSESSEPGLRERTSHKYGFEPDCFPGKYPQPPSTFGSVAGAQPGIEIHAPRRHIGHFSPTLIVNRKAFIYLPVPAQKRTGSARFTRIADHHQLQDKSRAPGGIRWIMNS